MTTYCLMEDLADAIRRGNVVPPDRVYASTTPDENHTSEPIVILTAQNQTYEHTVSRLNAFRKTIVKITCQSEEIYADFERRLGELALVVTQRIRQRERSRNVLYWNRGEDTIVNQMRDGEPVNAYSGTIVFEITEWNPNGGL